MNWCWLWPSSTFSTFSFLWFSLVYLLYIPGIAQRDVIFSLVHFGLPAVYGVRFNSGLILTISGCGPVSNLCSVDELDPDPDQGKKTGSGSSGSRQKHQIRRYTFDIYSRQMPAVYTRNSSSTCYFLFDVPAAHHLWITLSVNKARSIFFMF